jgi:hypothetical protein
MEEQQKTTVYTYTWEQAVEDGVLVKLFENRWQELTHGVPILATDHVFGEYSLAAFQEIWNEYVVWRQKVMPTLPEEERLFKTKMNSKVIWVIEDGVFTIMFPEDY